MMAPLMPFCQSSSCELPCVPSGNDLNGLKWEDRGTVEVFNFGNTSYWGCVRLCDIKKGSGDLLQLNYPSIDSLVVFGLYPDKGWRPVQSLSVDLGTDEWVDGSRFVFDLNESIEIVICAKSTRPLIIPISWTSKEEFRESEVLRNVFFGGYAGLMLVMFLFNVFIFLSTKDKSYLVFIFYIAIVACTQIEFQGFASRFFWDSDGLMGRYSAFILSYLVGLAGMSFFAEFLKPHKKLKWVSWIYRVVGLGYLVSFSLLCAGCYVESYKLILGTAGLLAISILTVSFILVGRGDRLARYYVISSGVVVSSVIIFVLKDVGLLAFNFLSFNSITIGSALEVTLLSFALADRINILTAEKKRSQARALQVLQENERIVREQNLLLEEKVKERTEELEKSNADLNGAYTDLQHTQSQLVEAEKMAGLGQMTAGIAHELNNPINYVSSNVNPLRRDVNEVFDVLDKYDAYAADKDDEALKEIKELEDQVDLPFLRTEIDQLLNGIREGAERSATIVKGLRIFSRLDEDTLKTANINDGLEATLIILKSNYKNQCEVVKQMQLDLPNIECYPGKLNQVFMNIITNAIQATVASDKPQSERKVTVATSTIESGVQILISDNGKGMPEDVKSRIFEPFYTTKKVGEGTGLGLSIVLGIVEQHQGSIAVESSPKGGSAFRITLPSKPS